MVSERLWLREAAEDEDVVDEVEEVETEDGTYAKTKALGEKGATKRNIGSIIAAAAVEADVP